MTIKHNHQIFVLLLLLCYNAYVSGSTPNIILSVDGVNKTWLAKRGAFGSDAELVEGRLVHSPEYDVLLCRLWEDPDLVFVPIEPTEPFIMLAPRGTCNFEWKAYAAKAMYGASAVLIYDNLGARYHWNDTTQSVIYPMDELDYECENGYGSVYNLELDPPAYDIEINDPILDMTSPTTNCTLAETWSPCESQLCLVTGAAAPDTSKYPVCCAWDLPTTMQGDDTAGDTSDIVAVWLTIRQGEEFLSYIGEKATVKGRPNPAFNPSMIILWFLGVTITFVACRFAASDYYVFRAKLARFQAKRDSLQDAAKGDEEEALAESAKENNNTGDIGIDDSNEEDESIGGDLNEDNLDAPDENFENEIEDDRLEDSPDDTDDMAESTEEENSTQVRSSNLLHENSAEDNHKNGKTKKKKKKKAKKERESWTLHSVPPPERKKRRKPGYKVEQTAETNILPTDSGDPIPEPWATPVGGFEMSQWHVFGFIGLASFMLFMLFFFQFYNVVFVIYGFGCAGAVSHLIFGPAFVRLAPKLGDDFVKELNKGVLCGLNGFDVTSQLLGFLWAIVWIWYGLTHYRPSTNVFFWISINVFGACFCILSLSMLKLNKIKIATMLLLAVFLYDIFFVFLTPLFLDGESVMITVAKGGGESESDDFCYKYPEDQLCTGIDFLPMLLVIPRFNDYTNGSALLGLGDIVLPGYLIAFCARLDEAKRIVGKHTKVEMEYTESMYRGYFFYVMVGYGIGLALAFVAFGVSGVGQPALLYLVPCCLGMLCLVGRKELPDLWKGAKAIRLADKLKTKCERAWGKEKMKRQVAKLKRERAEREGGDSRRQPSGPRQSAGRGNLRGSPNTGNTQRRPPENENSHGSSLTPRRKPGQNRPSSSDHRAHREGSRKSKGNTSPQDNQAQRTSTVPRPNAANNSSAICPSEQDICLGSPDHPGNHHLQKVVTHELWVNPHAEFSPTIYRSICSKLNGRNCFVSDDGDVWRLASNNERRSSILRLFEDERARLQAKARNEKNAK